MPNFTNDRVADDRTAKAYLKGQTREAIEKTEAAIGEFKAYLGGTKKLSLKSVEKLHKKHMGAFGDFLISSNKSKRIGVASSRHWTSEYITIEPVHCEYKGIGNLYRLLVGFFDSKKFIKGNHSKRLVLESKFHFHEHFLTRCIYRLNEKYIKNVGEFVYPIIEWLITENVPYSMLDKVNYFVYRDFTLVTHMPPHCYVMIFKTILKAEFYSNSDTKKFAEAHKLLSDSNPETTFVVMTDYNGRVISEIPMARNESLVDSAGGDGQSYWLQQYNPLGFS